MKISARPFQRQDARTSPEGAPTASGDEALAPESWPTLDEVIANRLDESGQSDPAPADERSENSLLEVEAVDAALAAPRLPAGRGSS
jgi:hypothetical protein